jgi:hypothetical protein
VTLRVFIKEGHRNILLKYLAMLGPAANLMITSRPHIVLNPFFPEVQTIEIRATDDDIRRYVNIQITEPSRLSRHAQGRPELREEIQSKIIENVKGMWVLHTSVGLIHQSLYSGSCLQNCT